MQANLITLTFNSPHRDVFYLTIQANEDVTQIVQILPSVTDKWTWLTKHLVSFTSGAVKKKCFFFPFSKEIEYLFYLLLE